jgi:hypothetical protein
MATKKAESKFILLPAFLKKTSDYFLINFTVVDFLFDFNLT